MPTLPHEQLGQIDIYLFDQLQRGRIAPGMRVLDAGSGQGRNIEYLLRAGFDVYACDADERAVEDVRRMARDLAPRLPAENFRAEPVEAMSFGDGSMDVVIASAVLHFARDEAHWRAMVGDAWRVLRSGGMFFCRLASSIGIEDRVQPLGGRRFRLPDGSDRFLVDEAMLVSTAAALGAALLDPIKTTIVSGQRCMTTWVLRKPA
jgi:tellurite methyltransferase